MTNEDAQGLSSVPPASVGAPREGRPDHQRAIPLENYLEWALDLGKKNRVQETETVPLADALDRYLAEDVVSEVPVPTFTNAAMDGYAIRVEGELSAPLSLKIVGEQPAGPLRDITVKVGEACRIMTGAPLPEGANTVVRSEYCGEDGHTVVLEQLEKLGANVRTVGEDLSVGATVVSAGTFLGPRDVSAIASVGQANVLVHKPLKVAIVSTGNELVAPGEPLAPGMIYESNSILLKGLLQRAGFEAKVFAAVADTEEGLRSAMDEAGAWANAALLSGGASFGKYDVVRSLLGAGDTSRFVRVQMQPGKPQGLGVWEGDGLKLPFMSFPGNPVSVFVSYQVFGLPFLLELLGTSNPPLTLYASAGEDWKSPAGRTQFLPGRLVDAEPGKLPVIYPVSPLGSGSHLVTSLGQANVLAVGPKEASRVLKGNQVEVRLF